jgi:HD-GYP domain-containing protein (c-di-GMP phosphodiesterase class II)
MSSKTNKQRALLGEKTLGAFHKLIQTAKIHENNNQLLIKCIKDFSGALRSWWTDNDDLTIKLSHGRFLIQDEKLYFQRENVKLIQEMYHFFETRKLSGLRFHSDLKGYSVENILRFARLINVAGEKDDPLAWIVEGLEKGAFPWVEILQLPRTKAHEQDFESKDMARKTYAYALTSVKEVAQKINSQRRAGVRKLKRIVQNMVDILSEDESVMLGISTMRDYDDYTYTHSVNVAILSLCLGKRIGLSRISLSHLAICGLVHDLGKLDIPKEILNKPGKLTDQEFKEMEKHPIKSVSQIMRMHAPEDLKAKILLPPFEHHLKYDLSGYPRVQNKKSVSLFGRILAIADVFDALTSPRIYRPKANSPDRALDIMLKGSGKDFDPILLKVFINMLGVYPVGTLLKLDTGELGLVVDCQKNGDLTRPRIVLLMRDDHDIFKKGKFVHLSAKHPETGSFKRNIVRSFHPSSFGLQPADFIL